MKQSSNPTRERGVSLYLALTIMAILLAIALGISAILLGQIRMAREMGNSVVAFYAADTGIENSLYNIKKEDGDGNFSDIVLANGSKYTTTASFTVIKSKGDFSGVNRAIEVSY